jgi:predicted SAM-dependent methyltransferase
MLTLNVGCGDRTYDEYPPGYKCINYDTRVNLKRVDVVGDARKLTFSDERFDMILASDIIEHFPIAETENILKEWKRVLKPGGIIEFRMPNAKTICKKYLSRKDCRYLNWLVMGAQDYSGNYHYSIFDRPWFKSIIEPLGFKEIAYMDEENNFIIKVRRLSY